MELVNHFMENLLMASTPQSDVVLNHIRQMYVNLCVIQFFFIFFFPKSPKFFFYFSSPPAQLCFETQRLKTLLDQKQYFAQRISRENPKSCTNFYFTVGDSLNSIKAYYLTHFFTLTNLSRFSCRDRYLMHATQNCYFGCNIQS